MVHSEVVWEGTLPITAISINFKQDTYKGLKSSLANKKGEIWRDMKKQEPWIYDGNLLFLQQLQISNVQLTLHTQIVKFSTIVTMEKYNARFPKEEGVIGIQVVIYSPHRDYILVGKRRKDQHYCPGYLTVPGGMLEEQDAYLPIERALMREIQEEVPLNVTMDKLTAILREHKHLSIILLLEGHLVNKNQFNPRNPIIPRDKSEWESGLEWLKLSDLKQLSTSQLMEGLSYLQNKQKKV